MSRFLTWLLTSLVIGIAVTAFVTRTHGDEPAKPKKPTVEEVVKQWSPNLESATAFSQIGGAPKKAPNVVAYSFRVAGLTYGDLWNHYAKLCGVERKYDPKYFLRSADDGPKGSYVVSDQDTSDGKGGRVLSVFLLKTDTYTATVTFQPDPDGKSISGSLSVIVP
jgi:hypothetical protein